MEQAQAKSLTAMGSQCQVALQLYSLLQFKEYSEYLLDLRDRGLSSQEYIYMEKLQ